MNWYKISSEKIMIVCRGISGSGKSTLAKELGKSGVVYSTDDFFDRDGEYKFNPALLSRAHQWNHDRTRKAMESGISPVVIDNTNTTLKEIFNYVKLARENGYKIKFAEPDWHPELRTEEGKWNADFISEMQKKRNLENPSKIIPDATVRKMIDRYQYRLPGETDEELAERVLLGGGFR